MKVLIRPEADVGLMAVSSGFQRITRARPWIRRIRAKLGLLATTGFAEIGRRERGTRELVVAPYIIVYEVHKRRDELVVLGVFHGAMRR